MTFNIGEDLQKHFLPIGIIGDDDYGYHIVLKPRAGHKRFTPCTFARDCGDHFTVAKFDHYDYIDKDTWEISRGLDDV